MLSKCKSLQDYATYVKILRTKQKEGLDDVAAVNAAVNESIRQNLLDGFFRIHKAEVLELSLTEFNQEEYDRHRREEGREEGLQEGRLETARKLLSHNVSVDIISSSTGLTLEQVEALR